MASHLGTALGKSIDFPRFSWTEDNGE
jgi:hypothetical protein